MLIRPKAGSELQFRRFRVWIYWRRSHWTQIDHHFSFFFCCCLHGDIFRSRRCKQKFSQPPIEGGKGRHLLGIEVVDILNHDVSQNVFLATNRVNLMNGHHVCFHTLLSSCLHETFFFFTQTSSFCWKNSRLRKFSGSARWAFLAFTSLWGSKETVFCLDYHKVSRDEDDSNFWFSLRGRGLRVM